MNLTGKKPSVRKRRKRFCEYGPVCYRISLIKEYLVRDGKDCLGGERFARTYGKEELPCIVKGHRSLMLRPLHGVDDHLQRNKITNLALAARHMDGLLIHPGETFSFWRLVGRVSSRRGYLTGMTIVNGKSESDTGGGLCQLANLVHWLVLNSPLTVTELHHHTDALFPDSGRRVPFGTGTSVFYKNVDYRFRNDTDRTVQLRVWQENDDLCGELRCGKPFLTRYRIEEEGCCFVREAEDYYRVSRVYKRTIDRKTGETLNRELILNNHSRVLYDHSLIPAEEIRASEEAYVD